MGVGCYVRYLRYCQPFRNGSEHIIIRSLAIVKAGGINKDNIASTTVRMRTADGLNFSSARFQVVADSSGKLSCRYVDKLVHRQVIY
jgi:hypothetical protein